MKLNDCGCCESSESSVSPQITNDPGLDKLEYRVGTFQEFKRSMLNSLDTQVALSQLTTRDDSDPTVATLDAWSTVLDVLTFYQERIANENYIRTADEYRSVLELGKEIGYRLAPGTAATTYVAFKTDDSSTGPESVRIDAGAKIQSQPGQDELPQIYETVETITAFPEYNEMPVQALQVDALGGLPRTASVFQGTDFEVKVGDILLFVNEIAQPPEQTGLLTRITAVEKDNNRKVTKLNWSEPLIIAKGSKPYIMRIRAAIWGYNAIGYHALPLTLTFGDKNPLSPNDPNTNVKGPFKDMEHSWADANLTDPITLDLESLYPSIVPGSWIAIRRSGENPILRVFKVTQNDEVVVDRFMLTGKATRLKLIGPELTQFSPKNSAVFAQSDPIQFAPIQDFSALTENKLSLVSPVDRPEAGRKLLIRGKRARIAFDAAMKLKDRADALIATIPPKEALWMQAAPVVVYSGLRYEVQRADGSTGFVVAATNAAISQPPLDDDDVYVGEIGIVADRQKGVADDPVQIPITSTLKYAYDRSTTVVYGNVAFATHGETKDEIIGSGNASKPFQAFALRNGPLTYLAAATESGYEGQLEVRVNDILWHEAPTLYGGSERDRIFTAREDAEMKTIVRFGDGKTGARPETGAENISAKYRVGSGRAGRVRAMQLNMPLTRPLGLVGALNPLPAQGGSDPEKAVDARRNGPKSILTLGRIVSVQDFEDYAARYPEVAKAQALLLWSDTRQVVHITVAGANGETIETAGLSAGLDAVRDTRFPVVVQTAEIKKFQVAISVLVKEDYLAEKVFPDVVRALCEDFGFDKRLFSEAVTTSEILASVQKVAGVTAAIVSILDLSTAAPPKAKDVLRVSPARSVDKTLVPAQMLLIDPAKITLKEMSREV